MGEHHIHEHEHDSEDHDESSEDSEAVRQRKKPRRRGTERHPENPAWAASSRDAGHEAQQGGDQHGDIPPPPPAGDEPAPNPKSNDGSPTFLPAHYRESPGGAGTEMGGVYVGGNFGDGEDLANHDDAGSESDEVSDYRQEASEDWTRRSELAADLRGRLEGKGLTADAIDRKMTRFYELRDRHERREESQKGSRHKLPWSAREKAGAAVLGLLGVILELGAIGGATAAGIIASRPSGRPVITGYGVTGSTVTIDVVDELDSRGGDDFDPSTLRIGTPGGVAAITDEAGTWTVNTTDGSVTFVPGDGQVDSPSSIAFAITSTTGDVTTGTLAIAYSDSRDLTGTGPVGSPIVIDVVGTDTTTLNAATVKIDDLDEATPAQTTLAPTTGGTWSVQDAGTVTFDPGTPPVTSVAPIAYSIDRTDGGTTFGTLSLTYEPARSRDLAGEGSADDDIVVDVIGAFDDLDPTSVMISNQGRYTRSIKLGDQGTWTADATTGSVTFSPGSGISTSPSPIMYRATRAADGVGVEGLITVTVTAMSLMRRIRTVAIIVPGHPGTTTPVRIDVVDLVEVGTFPAAPDSVRIQGLLTSTAAAQRLALDSTLADDGKTLTVPGEGSWQVQADGSIIYSPAPADGAPPMAPTPIVYNLTDDRGVASAASGTIIVSKVGHDLEEGALTTTSKADDDFWNDFTTQLIDDDRISIAVLGGVVQTLWADTRWRLSQDDPTALSDIETKSAQDPSGNYPLFRPSISNLWRGTDDQTTLLQVVNRTVTGNEQFRRGGSLVKVDSIPLATRYLRLQLLRRFIVRRLDNFPPTLASLRFEFESKPNGNFADVLADAPDGVNGPIATQNAGSSNAGLYYQTGVAPRFGGLNERFGDVFTRAGQLDTVNAMLRSGYDGFFGAGEFLRDGPTGRTDRLTSLLVELDSDGTHVGTDVRAMVYSVGPVLTSAGIVDEAEYQRIYYEAYERVAAYNEGNLDPILGLRITMLSTGIYAKTVTDVNALFTTAAKNILLGISHAVYDFGMHPGGFTVLINHDENATGPGTKTGFTAAATALGVGASANGFAPDPEALADNW